MTTEQCIRLEKEKMVSNFVSRIPELNKDWEICKEEHALQTAFSEHNTEHKVTAGQELVVAGYIGLYGALWLSHNCREELKTRLPEAFLRDLDSLSRHNGYCIQIPASELDSHDRNTVPFDVKTCYLNCLSQFSVSAAYAVGEGGINRPLFQLGKDSGIGYTITYTNVPIKQEIIEVCEHFDMDPWALYSGGCGLFVTSQGNALVRELNSHHIPAAVIGYMTKDKKKMVCHQGVESLVNRPEPDELLKKMKELYLK